MKKHLLLLLLMIISFVAVGCTEEEVKPKLDPPREIIILGGKEVLEIGETVQLTVKINPSTADQSVVWTSKDDTIITVEDGKVTAIGEGVTEVIVTSKVSTRLSKSIEFQVVKPLVYDDPESVEITGRRAEVGIGSFITLQAKVSPDTASQLVTWESLNEDIATVVDGKVTGKAEGVATIVAKTVANLEIFDTYLVNVIKAEDITELNPTDIIISGENSVYEGYVIVLTADVLPHGSSSKVFWQSSDEEIAKIDENGKVTGLKQGSVFITATSAKDTTVMSSKKITVKPDVNINNYPNLQGYEIKLMGSPGHTNEHDPFDDDYVIQDRVHRQNAWREIETLFNCKIVVTTFPETATWGPTRVSWINDNAAKGTNPADIMVITTEWMSSLANGNSIVDVTEYYEKYGKNQMPIAMRQASTYKGGLYSLITPTVGSLNTMFGLFYNVGLVEELGLESPAKIFNEGEWTYSKFLDYVKLANSQLEDGQTVLSGKPVLYWIGMTNAASVKLLDTITLQVNFNNQYARNAASILRQAYQVAGWGTNAYDSDATSFNEGNSIFQAGEFWFVRSPDRWKTDLWGNDTRFGFVPYPRPDEVLLNDTKTNGGDGQTYALIKGVKDRPAHVNDEYVYWAFTEVMIRTNNYMRKDPEFDETVAIRRTAERTIDDPESTTAAAFFKVDKLIFDPVIYGVYSYARLAPILDKVITEGHDYTEALDAESNVYLLRLIELYG